MKGDKLTIHVTQTIASAHNLSVKTLSLSSMH